MEGNPPITAVIAAIGFIVIAVIIIGFLIKDAMSKFKEK